MNWPMYSKLSAMFFMEFAVWGAWMPVLAARLLGPLKMTGKQTGWIYATLPLASLVAPLAAGQLADKYIDMRWILLVSHLIGAGLLLAASRIERFGPLFAVMLLYSLFFGATLPLANAMIFRHIEESGVTADRIFIWAPIAWALVGYLLTGWRQWKGGEGDGSDCLRFGALMSLVMAAVCFFMPATPPQPEVEAPLKEAFAMFRDPSFLTFMIVSLVLFAMMQFYFLCTAPFMQDAGVAGKNVPAAMAIAQAVQAVATWFLLGWLYTQLVGPKWTLCIGAAAWMLLYMVYVSSRGRSLIVGSQSLHGLAYVLFVNGAWMFTNDVAPAAISGSAQALYALVTNGFGLFLGTQLAGVIMDRFSTNGKFQWRQVFTVPLVCTLASVVAIALWVRNPEPKAEVPPPVAAAAEK